MPARRELTVIDERLFAGNVMIDRRIALCGSHSCVWHSRTSIRGATELCGDHAPRARRLEGHHGCACRTAATW